MQPTRASSANILIRSLSDEDFAILRPDLIRVPLSRGQVLAAPSDRVEFNYFPEGGVASIIVEMPNTPATEIGLFGREGMSGVLALLGWDRKPRKTLVQIEGGTALRIPVDRLRAAMDRSASLRALILRYVGTVLSQSAYSVICYAHHKLEARLARWLLMCSDRMDDDELPITHEFMAAMIGAQRSGVTVTLHVLEGVGAIRSKRGRVIITDREKLEELAGDAYGAAEAEYRRLIGPFGSIRRAEAQMAH
jgi:CRP-like cAMP-binding protein